MPAKHGRFGTLAMTLSRKAVIASSLAVVAAITVLFRVWGTLVTDDSLGIIRSQLTFTEHRFADVVQTFDIAEFVRLTATLDFVYPLAYAAAIAGVWARVAGPDLWFGSAWPLATAFGAAAADWLENAFHLIAIEPMLTGGEPIAFAVFMGSAFAALKWIGIVVALTATARLSLRRGDWTWRLVGAALAAIAGAVAGVALTAAF